MAAQEIANGDVPSGIDPEESLERLLRDLRTRREGLSQREAARRLVVAGPNELSRRAGRGWLRQLARELLHPLALLLWVAAALAQLSGTSALAIGIVVVILINALFAFVQERHAENAVEALSAYLPQQARVLREGRATNVDARALVPGDVVLVAEGDRVSADVRMLAGSARRAWGLMGGVSAVLVVALFLITLVNGGWSPGAEVDSGPLHQVWRQDTTMTFLGIVACQIGTAMAARTARASLRQIGVFSNRLLLWGIAFEIAFAAAVVLVPPLQEVFDTTAPAPWQVAALVPLPVLVWGSDELWRWHRRRTTG